MGDSHAAFHSMVLDHLRAAGRPCTGAGASSYPDRPIRFVIAFPPGGATDTFFRQLANELSDGARPVRRDREQRRRRRLHRLADGRQFATGRLHAAGGRECARDQPGALQEPPVGLRSAQALRRDRRGWRTRRWCSASPTTCRPRISPSSWPIRRSLPQKMNYAHAGIGSVSHLVFEVILDATGMQHRRRALQGRRPGRGRRGRRPRRRHRLGDVGRQGAGRGRQGQGHRGDQRQRVRRRCRTCRR